MLNGQILFINVMQCLRC